MRATTGLALAALMSVVAAALLAVAGLWLWSVSAALSLAFALAAFGARVADGWIGAMLGFVGGILLALVVLLATMPLWAQVVGPAVP
jgi:hypothetical protein